MFTRRELVVAGSVGLTGLPGCLSPDRGGEPAGASPPDESGDGASSGDATPPSGRTPSARSLPPGPYRYTHSQPTGNRRVGGSADLAAVEPVRFDPEGRPVWLVAAPAGEGTGWTVVTADGAVTTWRVVDGGATRVSRLDRTSPDAPPIVATGGDEPSLVPRPAAATARSGSLVAAGADGADPALVSVTEGGQLVVRRERGHRLSVDALPDARPAAVGDGRVAVFAEPTDRYGHGALGDGVEPTALLVVDPSVPEVTARAALSAPAVFEGLQPLVADLNGDGRPEVVTTVADTAEGARIAVFSPAGDRLATGPIHGSGWRHQLAVAPLGPDGAPELAVVRKPHVEHVLEFYRLAAGDLSVVAERRGFSSHTYGSRILDGGIAADVDGDGAVEMVVPSTDRQRLVGIRRTPDGTTASGEFPLDGGLASNVTGVERGSGGLAVGAGTAEAVRVWQG